MPISATPTGHGLMLSWTESTTGASFNINRSPTSGTEIQIAQVPAGTFQYLDPVMDGKTYFYTVAAVLNGVSAVSNEVTATAPLAPAAPVLSISVV